MFYRAASFLCLRSLIMLGACSQTPPLEDGLIDFGTDPRILRGIWTGKNEAGITLTLDLKTKDPTEQGYFSIGMFKLGDAPAVPFTAEIRAPIATTALSPNQQADTPTCDSTGAVANTFETAQDLFCDVCGTTPESSPPEFRMTLTDRNGPEPVTSEFVLVRQPDEPTPEFLVSGTIEHVQGVSHTYDGEFVFTEDSHAIVQLWYVPQYGGEFTAELLAQTTTEDITSFPISVRLEGDALAMFERFGDYYLNVGVFSGDGGESGETFAVGDLVNEIYTAVPEAGAEVRVEVTGLEACSSPDAGGFCLSR